MGPRARRRLREAEGVAGQPGRPSAARGADRDGPGEDLFLDVEGRGPDLVHAALVPDAHRAQRRAVEVEGDGPRRSSGSGGGGPSARCRRGPPPGARGRRRASGRCPGVVNRSSASEPESTAMPPITPRWSWIGVTCPDSQAISMTSQSSQRRIGWRMYCCGMNRTRSRYRSASRARSVRRGDPGVARSGSRPASTRISRTDLGEVHGRDSTPVRARRATFRRRCASPSFPATASAWTSRRRPSRSSRPSPAGVLDPPRADAPFPGAPTTTSRPARRSRRAPSSDLRADFDAIFMGAFGDPRVPDMKHARGHPARRALPARPLRQLPAGALPGRPALPAQGLRARRTSTSSSSARTPRARTSASGGNFKKGTPDEVAIQEDI